MTELNIVEDKALREQVAGRVEVLDKVKELFLLPELEMMTAPQVAEWYQVPVKTLLTCYSRNKEEVELDGAQKITSKAFQELFPQLEEIVRTQGYREFKLSEEVTLRVPHVGTVMFPRRAILRIGMLLRDSEVAKEVRTQLLNTFEHASIEARTQELDAETEVAVKFGLALAKGDQAEAIAAYAELMQYCNRYKESNKMLANEVLHWDSRPAVVSAVKIIANETGIEHGAIWSELYKELYNKHKISLKIRKGRYEGKGSPSLISFVREDEWPAVQQSLAAMCEKYQLNAAEIFEKSKVEFKGV